MTGYFTDIMTVYNYYRNEDTDDEMWIRHIIHGVQWLHNKTEVTSTGNVTESKKVESITVDFQRDYGDVTYLDPVSYRRLPEEKLIDFWTLDTENNLDILVLGEAAEEITRAYKTTDLQKDYQYSGTLKSVSDNRNRNFLKHIKAVVE